MLGRNTVQTYNSIEFGFNALKIIRAYLKMKSSSAFCKSIKI